MCKQKVAIFLMGMAFVCAGVLSWAETGDDWTIIEGRGLKTIGVGDDTEQALLVLGPPDSVHGGPDLVQLVYKKTHKFHFLVRRKEHKIVEARFDRGYQGRLTNGIGLDAPLSEVLRLYGGANKTVTVSMEDAHHCSQGTDKVLYHALKDGKVAAHKFITTRHGVLFWFDAEGRVSQIVAVPKATE